MNSEEGTSLAKMAVSVLLVVLVIGAVVTVVYMAYSWFTSGSEKLGDQVNSLDSSAYSQYDDKQVTGTDVLTALKTYRDSDVAIFIDNGKLGDGYKQAAESATVKNYCALADPGDSDPKAAANGTYDMTLFKDKGNGKWYIGTTSKKLDIDFNPETGMANRNTNFSPTQTKGTDYDDAYVSQKANFYSNLVYDSEDEVCGILFRRMSANGSGKPATP